MNDNTKWWITTIMLILILAGMIYDVYWLVTSKESSAIKYTNGVFLLITFVVFYYFSTKSSNGFSDIMQKIRESKPASV